MEDIKQVVDEGTENIPAEVEDEIKTFTQEEVDEMIKKRLSRLEDKKEKELRERIEQEQKEAKRLAEMDAEQRAEELKAKTEQELETTKARLNRVLLENDTKTILAEENLPLQSIDFVLGNDAEQTKANIDSFKAMFEDAVQRGVKEQLKGKTPKIVAGNQPNTNNPWVAGSINLTEQGRILKEDPELAIRLQREARGV